MRDHERLMYRDCRRCQGGRMFWHRAEPQFEHILGYVGLCAMCGFQVFTNDLLRAPRYEGGANGYHKNYRPDYLDQRIA